MKIQIANLGRINYDEALELQEKIMALRQEGKIEDTLLLLEHPPVITIGRRGNESNILLSSEEIKDNGIGIYEVSRGGDVTYHGPGQMVGYPIMDLNNFGKDIKEFVWKVEEVFIRLLDREYGIKAERDEKKYTGVWVGDSKITAIGIAVKRWVTMHGFAFNVNTDLEHFKWIVPCGITDKGVTSVQNILGHAEDFDKMCNVVAKTFCEVFGLEAVYLSKEELLRTISNFK
ncbi:MAG: lipoyl(octanoyl) transferase LipB [Clostridia bacterium]|nr:lipoyl(octanoyl) transferase LipB [Clostridia bacterium]